MEKTGVLLACCLVVASGSQVEADCVSYASAICDTDASCVAFGLHGSSIQFHGCATTVPNKDWAIFVKPNTKGAYARLSGHINVNESACAQHPHVTDRACPPASPTPAPPTPPSLPKPYKVEGTMEVGTLENTVFSWHGTLYLLENIASGWYGSAEQWFPEYRGHSYARIRRFEDGIVVTNISSSIGFGFVSAFPDYKHDRVWLFGTNHDRSGGGGPPGGYPCPGETVTSWRSSGGADLTTWKRACTDAVSKDNVEVASVAAPPGTLPPHGYVMSDECPGFRILDAPDGDLTTGWVVPDGTKAGPCGGPSVRWAPEPGNATRGYYYRITGGHTVALARSRDLRDPWQSVEMISPTPQDANVSRFLGFAARASQLGFQLNHDHWQAWDRNSNDADVCCMDPTVNGSYLVWGASTQGGTPDPPVPHNQSCVNAVGTSALKLPELLDAFFDTPLPPV